MRITKSITLSAVAVATVVAGSAQAAGPRTASGSAGGLDWTASSRIIGQTSTGTPAEGGNPLYYATDAAYRGVVGLLMDYGPEIGRFVCTGSLLNDRRTVVTAGHCVSGGAGTANPIKTTAFFYDGDPTTNVYRNDDPAIRTIDVSKYTVNANYTGEVIDQNDIALLTLPFIVPASYGNDYDILTAGDLTGVDFNVAGLGARSDVGGAAGRNLGTGYLRQGDNRYDYAWGDEGFGGFFTDEDADGENFFGSAEVEFSYVSDFDNGLAAQDQACRIALAVGAPPSTRYCDLGRGLTEVGIAGGDSGGPAFVDGLIASINSYGLTFGEGFGDFGGGLNSGWGEFSGYVPTFIHEDFIRSNLQVPAPAALGLMLGGLGMMGAMRLRRRKTA